MHSNTGVSNLQKLTVRCFIHNNNFRTGCCEATYILPRKEYLFQKKAHKYLEISRGGGGTFTNIKNTA